MYMWKKNSAFVFSWWESDFKNYSSIVKKRLNQNNDQEEKIIRIVLNEKEWETATKSITKGSNGRRKFKIDFDRILSIKFQEARYNCWLVCNFNWFKKHQSKKKKCYFWNGNYSCLNKNCAKFEAFIETEPVFGYDVIVNLKVKEDSSFIEHEKLKKEFQLRGHRRQQLLNNIMLYGTDQARSKMLVENHENNESLSND